MTAPLVNQSSSQGPFKQGHQDNKPKVFGKTYGEWAAEWVKWAEAANFAPIIDETGASCGANQPKSGVWFLAGTFGDPVKAERTCAIPHDRYLFYPLVESFWIDCLGTPDEDLSDAEVRAIQAESFDNAAELTSTVDGVTVAGLEKLIVRAQSPNFSSILPEGTILEGCSPPGKTGRQIVDGYWVMLPPLSSGRHELTLHGSIIKDLSRDFETEATYHLTVGAGGQ